MTRIFDALRKAQAAGAAFGAKASSPPTHSQVTPLPTPAHAAIAARGAMPRAIEGRLTGMALQGSVEQPDDVVREMTTLRISIESALPEHTQRVIAFASSQSGEGSSTVAMQFAQGLAADGQLRPIYIDANPRRPAIEYDPARRVAVLKSRLVSRRAEAGVLVANLGVVPVPEEARRTGIFAPNALRDMLERVGEEYDWVIVDLPAVLESPDASPLGALTQGVIVVVQAGRTKRPVLTRSVELLRKAGARVLGSVLNRRRLEIPEFIYRRV